MTHIYFHMSFRRHYRLFQRQNSYRGLLGRHLGFSTSALVVQYYEYVHWIAGPRKHCGSLWNFSSMSSRSRDRHFIRFWALLAAILDFRLPVWSDSIRTESIELLDPENVGFAVEIAFLSSLQAEICTSGLLAAILDFRLPVWSDNISSG